MFEFLCKFLYLWWLSPLNSDLIFGKILGTVLSDYGLLQVYKRAVKKDNHITWTVLQIPSQNLDKQVQITWK